MRHRDRQPEQMDDPEIPREDHIAALNGLARLNRVSGLAGTMYRHLRRRARARSDRSLKVLDVASGAGDVPIVWAKRAQRDGWNLELTLVDIRDVAIEQQQLRAQNAGVSIESIQRDCLNEPLPGGFDLVTSSLFFHHLDEHQLFCLLQSMHDAADGALLVSDLARSRTNLVLVSIAAAAVTRSPVVHHDAAASVRAAFTADEFRRIAEDALTRPVHVHSAFPCRFIAELDEVAIEEPVPAFA